MNIHIISTYIWPQSNSQAQGFLVLKQASAISTTYIKFYYKTKEFRPTHWLTKWQTGYWLILKFNGFTKSKEL